MQYTAAARSPKKFVARGASIPAPTGGWDALSPLANMPPDRAITLENWFPHFGYVELRNGHILQADTLTDLPVETIMPYQGATGTALFAASDDTIFDVTTPGSATAAVTGLANARFQYTMFATTGGHYLWCPNGADDPQYYDGSVWASAAITGTGVTGPNWISAVPYKGRLWGVIKNSTKAAYLPLDSIQGAAAAFEVGAEFAMGGYLEAIGVWSTDSNDGPTSYLVFVSSRGEILVYNIADPTSPSGVQLLSKGLVGQPVGRRCLTQLGADLALICQDGVIPISQCLTYDRAALIKVAVTANIQPVVSHAIQSYGSNFGWSLTSYPKSSWGILNVPIVEGQNQEQFVMNTITGAWCRFIGMNANCWSLYNDDVYFGGNNGQVFKADTSSSDYGEPITARLKTAFNYFKSRGTLKRWTMCQPLIVTDGTVTPGLAIDVDFGDSAMPIATPSDITPRAEWDSALWDENTWPLLASLQARWQAVNGLGYCAAVKMAVTITGTGTEQTLWDQGVWDESAWDAAQTEGIVLQVNGFNLLHENAVGQFI